MIVIRYLRDAGCGTLFPEKMKLDLNGLAKGATEMTVRLLEHNNEANETSIQAVGWIGEKGNAKACFQLLTVQLLFPRLCVWIGTGKERGKSVRPQ